MSNENINIENEVFGAQISEGQAIYGLRLTPEYLINDLKAKSIEYVISANPPKTKIKRWLKKYQTVMLVKDGDIPRITLFFKNQDNSA